MNDRSLVQRPFTFWHLAPDETEGACGFFLRMVAAEGLPNARTYAKAIGVITDHLLAPDFIDTLFKLPLPDKAKASLRNWTPHLEEGFYRLSGCLLRQGQVSTWKRRYCPACLALRPYHRAWWDILAVKSCPLHDCVLQTTYGNGRLLPWRWPDFSVAPDGSPLSIAMPLTDGRHMFEHFVVRKLGVIHDDLTHPILEGAELHEVIDICGHIGRFFDHPWRTSVPPSRRGDRPYQTGFTALAGTYQDLVRHFRDWLESNRERTFGVGMQVGFGWLQRGQLTVTNLSRRWTIISEAQREAYGSFSKLVGKRGKTRFKYETLRYIARALDVPTENLKAFLADIDMLQADMGYTEENRCEIQVAINNLLTPTEVGARLGCTPTLASRIGLRGVIKAYPGLRGMARRYSFRACDVNAFAEALEALEVRDYRGPLVSLTDYSAETGISEVAVVKKIMDGELVPARRRGNAKGLNALRFQLPPKEFILRVADDEITYGGAKAMLGVSQETVPALVNAGILQAGAPNRHRPYLTKKSIDEFRRRYVNAGNYRKQMQCGTTNVVQTVERLGVARHFEDTQGVKDCIVEREQLFLAIGLKELPQEVMETWERFQAIVQDVCPAYLLPGELSSKTITFFNSTRVTRFTVDVAGDAVVVRKRFNKRAAREWRWLLSNRKKAYQTLAIMHLRKVSDADEIEGQVVLESEKVMRDFATAIGEFHHLLTTTGIR